MKNARVIIDERERLFKELMKISSIAVYPSEANFLLIKVDDAAALFTSLKESRILVKSFAKHPQLINCIRVTVGKPEENIQFFDHLKSYYG